MWHVGVFSNHWILAGVTAQTIGQLAITYVPTMNTVFQTAPITPQAWVRILAIAAAATIVVAIDKRLRRQFA
jgi:cation-transporting ATPase F